MQQAKFSLTDPLVEFITGYKTYGFKDKSDMVRTALAEFQQHLETQALRESADLYAELYDTDTDLQTLTEAATADWPA